MAVYENRRWLQLVVNYAGKYVLASKKAKVYDIVKKQAV
jgi:hypothetical protein